MHSISLLVRLPLKIHLEKEDFDRLPACNNPKAKILADKNTFKLVGTKACKKCKQLQK